MHTDVAVGRMCTHGLKGESVHAIAAAGARVHPRREAARTTILVARDTSQPLMSSLKLAVPAPWLWKLNR